MTKAQITLTMEKKHIKALKRIADEQYEGNVSMALRMFFETKKLVECTS
jgi:hypothetical protein